MYELYISPDLLNKGEWNALSKSLKWAENRFPVLDHTFMTGGNPAKGQAYGYVHYTGNKGIIAVRNPEIKKQDIQIKLSASEGMDPDVNSLVLERVYPTHWISPDLYSAGATIDLPLEGYESAIYEVYPLDSAKKPLLAGVTFEVKSAEGNHTEISVLKAGKEAKLLNPRFVNAVSVNGSNQLLNNLSISDRGNEKILDSKQLSLNGPAINSELDFSKDVITPRFVVFLHPDSAYQGEPFPDGKLVVDGREVKATRQEQNGVWSDYSFMLPEDKSAGKHTFQFVISPNSKVTSWSGKADVWLITQQRQEVQSVRITTKESIKQVPMPPSPFYNHAIKQVMELGNGNISL